MRIAVNATFVSERHNGTTTFVDGMLQSLGSMGHEVIVYSSSERYRELPQWNRVEKNAAQHSG